MAKMAKWRRHTVEFKRQAVERMKTCQNIQELARELKVGRKLLYTWKYQLEGRGHFHRQGELATHPSPPLRPLFQLANDTVQRPVCVF